MATASAFLRVPSVTRDLPNIDIRPDEDTVQWFIRSRFNLLHPNPAQDPSNTASQARDQGEQNLQFRYISSCMVLHCTQTSIYSNLKVISKHRLELLRYVLTKDVGHWHVWGGFFQARMVYFI